MFLTALKTSQFLHVNIQVIGWGLNGELIGKSEPYGSHQKAFHMEKCYYYCLFVSDMHLPSIGNVQNVQHIVLRVWPYHCFHSKHRSMDLLYGFKVLLTFLNTYYCVWSVVQLIMEVVWFGWMAATGHIIVKNAGPYLSMTRRPPAFQTSNPLQPTAWPLYDKYQIAVLADVTLYPFGSLLKNLLKYFPIFSVNGMYAKGNWASPSCGFSRQNIRYGQKGNRQAAWH